MKCPKCGFPLDHGLGMCYNDECGWTPSLQDQIIIKKWLEEINKNGWKIT